MKLTIFKPLICLTLIGIIATFLGIKIAKAQHKSLTITDANGRQVINYNESHALVIWVKDYQHWGQLNNVENEAKDVKAALERQGFKVTVVGNPNGDKLRDSIKTFINNYGYNPDNRLVIFFAGHGHTLQDTEGYIVPADAPDPIVNEQGFWQIALSMQEMITFAKRIKSKHVLFVFDSCFSGTIFKQRSANNQTNAYIKDVMNKPVRQFLTAGDADEKVPAKSVFTPLFIRALEGEADVINQDGYVTGWELGTFLRQNLREYTKAQTPQFGTIRNVELDQGDIVFRALQTTATSSSPHSISSHPTSSDPNRSPLPRSTPSITIKPKPSPLPVSPPPTPRPTNLTLAQLLANKRWREANDKTWERLIREGDKNNNGILESSEVEKLQCQTLLELDDMWSKYSNGKYGFSVQRRVYSETHSAFSFKESNVSNVNTYTEFAQKVGWYQNNRWLSANDLFNQVSSQSGFFPLWFIYQGKLGQNPFGLPSNYKFIRDPNAIIVSPGTMLGEKLEICPI